MHPFIRVQPEIICVVNRQMVLSPQGPSLYIQCIQSILAQAEIDRNKEEQENKVIKGLVCPTVFHFLCPCSFLEHSFKCNCVELMDNVALGKIVMYGWFCVACVTACSQSLFFMDLSFKSISLHHEVLSLCSCYYLPDSHYK